MRKIAEKEDYVLQSLQCLNAWKRSTNKQNPECGLLANMNSRLMHFLSLSLIRSLSLQDCSLFQGDQECNSNIRAFLLSWERTNKTAHWSDYLYNLATLIIPRLWRSVLHAASSASYLQRMHVAPQATCSVRQCWQIHGTYFAYSETRTAVEWEIFTWWKWKCDHAGGAAVAAEYFGKLLIHVIVQLRNIPHPVILWSGSETLTE
jgi:hypothetical protein